MDWLTPAQVAVLIGAIVLVAVFGYLYASSRETHLGLWTAAWVAYAARAGFDIAHSLVTEQADLLFAGAQVMNVASVSCSPVRLSFSAAGSLTHGTWLLVLLWPGRSRDSSLTPLHLW
ncbi:MAG: hypothetical protein KGZ40_04555 [Clostridiales bacterium]|nr:hypothetical protein [Clostridiales bacterium]